MPELPEIETIVRRLRDPCVNRTIVRVRIRWPRHVDRPSPSCFKRKIKGQRIQSLKRRGKYLVFSLSSYTLLIHLRMSGDLALVQHNEQLHKHEHTVICFDNNFDLRFSDARKFGRVYLVEQPEDILSKLGPEPLDNDFTANDFAQRLSGKRRSIKPLLLDQAFLAGVGNIYADEALHLARIHPVQRSDMLSRDEMCRLWRSLRRVLRDGIRHNGSSIDWIYRGGTHQNYLRVYQRTGDPCPTCDGSIHKITVSQRGTHYCPRCQEY